MPAHRPPFQVIAHIDGASRGNPGPAAYGVVLESEDGTTLTTLSRNFGLTTNNVAEYHALLAALDYALAHHVQRLKVLSDSELLVRQIQGAYKVRSLDLKPLHERARSAIAKLEAFSIEYVPREQNREADRLANRALDRADKDFHRQDTKTQSHEVTPKPLRVLATYREGTLRPQQQLPLAEGQEVEIEVRRKK